jgi:hypothetical protein
MIAAQSKLGHTEPLAVCIYLQPYRVLQIANRADITNYCQNISYFLLVLLCFIMIIIINVLLHIFILIKSRDAAHLFR